MGDVSEKHKGPLWKPPKREKAKPKYIKTLGRVGKARGADRRRKLRDEPARYDGKRLCYICLEWHEQIDLEHVDDQDKSLRHHPKNHKWACNPCNINKKLGRLSATQQARVDEALQEIRRTE